MELDENKINVNYRKGVGPVGSSSHSTFLADAAGAQWDSPRFRHPPLKFPARVTPRIRQDGQTLVALLFFVMVGMIVTTAAVFILSTNALAAQKLSQGEVTRQIAETGAENALLRLLRDKTYTGETLTNIGGIIGDNATITVATSVVSGVTVKTIDSTATSGNFTRKIEVTANSNDVLTPTSWIEIY